MKPSDLSPLISRIGEAKGPDREIDARIYFAMAVDGLRFREMADGGTFVLFLYADGSGAGRDVSTIPYYTASLDAALALVERKLSGADISIVSDRGDGPWWKADIDVWARPSDAQTSETFDGEAATPALALCLALLRALEASADAG